MESEYSAGDNQDACLCGDLMIDHKSYSSCTRAISASEGEREEQLDRELSLEPYETRLPCQRGHWKDEEEERAGTEEGFDLDGSIANEMYIDGLGDSQ